MDVIYDRGNDVYYARERIDNQTLELGMNCIDWNELDHSSIWNIYLSLFNKKKDMYSNMDKKVMTGLNPFQTFKVAKRMFQEVENRLLQSEFFDNDAKKIVISCTWVDNRRRDAYYKVLHKLGYNWGKIDGKKCIMKTYRKEDF